MTDAGPAMTVPDRTIDEAIERLVHARGIVQRTVIGQDAVVRHVMVAMLAEGHVLLEGAPGLGKTLLVRTIARVCGLRSSRIQFTPDLMPADVTGANVLRYDEEGRASTRFAPGPIFAEMVLADEINRATPKTQSALLEAMQERTVTVAGDPYPLPTPFLVLATQNPIEMEGTYSLPEAQVDRFFFKVDVPFPSDEDLAEILASTTTAATERIETVMSGDELVRLQTWVREVPIPRSLLLDVARFARSTQAQLPTAEASVRKSIRFGVSPRGAQALVLGSKANALLDGRYAVAPEDVIDVALPALRHRIQATYDAESEGTDVMDVVLGLLKRSLS